MVRVFAVSVLAVVGLLAAPAHAAETLDLLVGQQRVLSVPGVTRLAIANPSVADVKVVDTSQVLVTAVAAGQTELTVWQGSRVSKYVVSVATMDPQQVKREVERQLGDSENIRVRIGRDNQVTLEGTVLTLAELEKADAIAQKFQLKNQVRLDASAHSHIAEALNRQLVRAGLTGARATVLGNTIFLEGVVDSEADMKKAEIITRGIGENIQTALKLGAARMVELDVEFVEVSKSSLDRIGVRWPTDISGTLTLSFNARQVYRGSTPDSSIFGITAETAPISLGATLQFNDGVTRTLARPRLVTASGKEASFLAGGEVPIPVVTQDRIYVDYKEYGVRLEITPVVDGAGTIQTKIMTEVSDLDPAVAVNGFPGFLSRRVDTDVTVRDGETIVLSGLMQASESKDVTKVPILGHIPILGELFKSRNFRDKQTELVVFVTPRVVDPVSKHLRELSTEMLRKYDAAKSDVGFSLFD